jgi:hypothetical protein
MTTGANGYTITSIQIDGTAANVIWPGGSIPVYGSNSSTSYTYTIIKTSTTPTYTVLGSGTRYQ